MFSIEKEGLVELAQPKSKNNPTSIKTNTPQSTYQFPWSLTFIKYQNIQNFEVIKFTYNQHSNNQLYVSAISQILLHFHFPSSFTYKLHKYLKQYVIWKNQNL